MNRFSLITLFPEFFSPFLNEGVVGRSLNRFFEVAFYNPRQFVTDKYGRVDDRPFGGGDGMVMMAEPLGHAVQAALKDRAAIGTTPTSSRVIALSPQGTLLNSAKAELLSKSEHLVLVCGRYSGMDQRFIDHYVDEEISIGDYVLSGGEIPAMILIEAVTRFIPGVLGHQESAHCDSFVHGQLEHPLYTRPRVFEGAPVPEILLSGDHQKIEEWKKTASYQTTLKKRPDLISDQG